jgi:sugar lactone lactonase YvrE
MNLLARLLPGRSLAPQPSRTSAARRHTFVPQIEALEAREVPATLLASGLEGAQGSTVGPGHDLYVTESVAGRIARIDSKTGEVTTFASGLPSGPYAGFGGGAVDVAFLGHTAYVLVTGVGPDVGGTDAVGIYRVDGPTSFTVIADIGTWSTEHPPQTDFELPTGYQYALEPYHGGFLVTDGHHNRVLHVELDGTITEEVAFSNIVPNGLAVRGNTVYVAEAGPVPHLPENGKVGAFGPRMPPTTVAAGAPLLVDVEFGRGDTLYALSQGTWDGVYPGDPARPNTGSLVRVNGDGTFSVVEDGLDRPTSLEFSGTTAYVVTLAGDVLRIGGATAPPLTAHQIHGGGQALLTDPAGQDFPLTFGLTGLLHADGPARGVVNFFFGLAFGQAWGAVPGADSIRLEGTVTSFTVAADGTVTLEGRLTEKDYARGGGVAFIEENVPFMIVLRPGREAPSKLVHGG